MIWLGLLFAYIYCTYEVRITREGRTQAKTQSAAVRKSTAVFRPSLSYARPCIKCENVKVRFRESRTILPSNVPKMSFAVGSAVSPAAAGIAVAVGAVRLTATKKATDVMVDFMMLVLII